MLQAHTIPEPQHIADSEALLEGALVRFTDTRVQRGDARLPIALQGDGVTLERARRT